MDKRDYVDEQEVIRAEVLRHTADIVAAVVGRNPVSPTDVPNLIQSVHEALSGVAEEKKEEPRQEPAVPIRRSVTPDYLICLEDGKRLKMLKRHLMTAYGMTPDEYRQKWGLPPDYPMVAPNYAKQRSELAKKIGLGRKPEPVRRSGRRRAAA